MTCAAASQPAWSTIADVLYRTRYAAAVPLFPSSPGALQVRSMLPLKLPVVALRSLIVAGGIVSGGCVAVGVDVLVAVFVGVELGVGVLVAVALAVGVGVDVDVAVSVGVVVTLGVSVVVTLGVGVGVLVGRL